MSSEQKSSSEKVGGLEAQAKALLEKMPKFRHYIIRDTIMEGQAGAGAKVIVARCDKYSDYATSEDATWMKEVNEMVEQILAEHQQQIQKINLKYNQALSSIKKLADRIIDLEGRLERMKPLSKEEFLALTVWELSDEQIDAFYKVLGEHGLMVVRKETSE